MLHDFDDDFYGEDLRLAIVGYIRPEVLECNECRIFFSYMRIWEYISCRPFPVFLTIWFGPLQANFPSLESLIEKIHEDRRIAETALELPLYSKYREDPYLKSSLNVDNCHL